METWRDTVTDNFKIISHKEFQVPEWMVYEREIVMRLSYKELNA